MSPEVTRRKLVYLKQYLSHLEKFKKISKKDYPKHHFEIERLLQLIVEVACDINSHIVVRRNEKPPPDYYQSFIDLGKTGVISQPLAKKLAPSSALRNALIHAYEEIDDEKVRRSITLALKYFPRYIESLQQYYQREKKVF